MGLSNAMSGGIILFGLMYVIFTFTSITDVTIGLNDVLFERSILDDKRAKTSIDVTILTEPTVGNIFSFTVENTNLEKLYDYDKFNVIVTYTVSSVTYVESLVYITTCPPMIGEWCINYFTDDNVEPGILNEDEFFNSLARISNTLEVDSTVNIKIVTPNGVSSVTNTIVV